MALFQMIKLDLTNPLQILMNYVHVYLEQSTFRSNFLIHLLDNE